MEQAYLTAIEIVKAAFPGQGFIELKQFAKFSGLGESTCREWLSQGRFPIPTVAIGGRRRIAVPAIVEYLAGASTAAPTEIVDEPAKIEAETQKPANAFPEMPIIDLQQKRKPGRPTNRERDARARQQH